MEFVREMISSLGYGGFCRHLDHLVFFLSFLVGTIYKSHPFRRSYCSM